MSCATMQHRPSQPTDGLLHFGSEHRTVAQSSLKQASSRRPRRPLGAQPLLLPLLAILALCPAGRAATRDAYAAICTNVRDEGSYLLEFILYHQWLGFGKVYVMDYNSSRPLSTLNMLLPLIRKGEVRHVVQLRSAGMPLNELEASVLLHTRWSTTLTRTHATTAGEWAPPLPSTARFTGRSCMAGDLPSSSGAGGLLQAAPGPATALSASRAPARAPPFNAASTLRTATTRGLPS